MPVCPCQRVGQVKKKAIEMRGVLELIMTKVGILRDLVNDLTRFKQDGTYGDEDLSDESLQHVDASLTNFIQALAQSPKP